MDRNMFINDKPVVKLGKSHGEELYVKPLDSIKEHSEEEEEKQALEDKDNKAKVEETNFNGVMQVSIDDDKKKRYCEVSKTNLSLYDDMEKEGEASLIINLNNIMNLKTDKNDESVNSTCLKFEFSDGIDSIKTVKFEDDLSDSINEW